MSPIIGLSAKPWPEKPAATSRPAMPGTGPRMGRSSGVKASSPAQLRASAHAPTGWKHRARRLEARPHALLQHLVAIARVIGDARGPAAADQVGAVVELLQAEPAVEGAQHRPERGRARRGEQHLERARLDRQRHADAREERRAPRARGHDHHVAGLARAVAALDTHHAARPRPGARATSTPSSTRAPSRRAACAKRLRRGHGPRPARRSARARRPGNPPRSRARARAPPARPRAPPAPRRRAAPPPTAPPRASSPRRAPGAGRRSAGIAWGLPARDRARASARGSRARAPAPRDRVPSPARRPRWPRRRRRPRGRAPAR